MGFLDLLATGYLAKRAHNTMSPPVIEAPDGVLVVGVKAKGMNEYRIKYRENSRPLNLQFREIAFPCLEDGGSTGTSSSLSNGAL